MTHWHYSTASSPPSPLWLLLPKPWPLLSTPLYQLWISICTIEYTWKTHSALWSHSKLTTFNLKWALVLLRDTVIFPWSSPCPSLSWPLDLPLPHLHSQVEIIAFCFTERPKEIRRKHPCFPTILSAFLSQWPDSWSLLLLWQLNCPSANRPGSRETKLKVVASYSMEDMI